MSYDVAVVGSGPQGWEAAQEAARHKLRVLVVDDGGLSKTGALRRLDVATRTLRDYAISQQRVRDLSMEPGRVRPSEVPMARLMARAGQMAETLARQARTRLEKRGVTIEPGPAQLLGPGRLSIRGAPEIAVDHVVLAADSLAHHYPGLSLPVDLLTSIDDIPSLLRVPRNLLVVGAERDGCTIASVFAALGSDVTLVDRRDRMLRYVDREVLETFHGALQDAGVEVALGDWPTGGRRVGADAAAHVRCELASGRVGHFERIFAALGVRPDLACLSALECGRQGALVTDDRGATESPRLWAAGRAVTAAGGPLGGRTVMRAALGLPAEAATLEPITIPSLPGIGMVGLTQEMCTRLDLSCAACFVPVSEPLNGALPGSLAAGVKLVVDSRSRRILGVHAVGQHAPEFIQFGVNALRGEASVDEVANLRALADGLHDCFREAALGCVEELPDPVPESCLLEDTAGIDMSRF